METSILSFSFDQSISIRTVIIDHEPWFVGKDVAAALGYVDTKQAIRDNCKRAKSLKELGASTRHPYQNQQLTLDPQTKLIPEPDVYRLISRSQLPSAERFETWVFEEVLPSIRKTGGYQAPAPAPTFEHINSADIAALEAIVHRIKYNFHYQDMAAHAIYSGIRRIYGLKHSVNNLPTCYFHDVLNLLAEVERVSRLFQGMALESEKRFFHRVLRPMLPFNEQEWQRHLDNEFSQIEAHHERTLSLIARYQPIN
ncbi:hypothetical protein CKO12_10150 [Chromatium okenii]|uniref:BRO-N domain-containing protein n=1 Tax=Chromatium okenii TaxID=61644 RepID=UPI0019052A50|nr:BRO family protein [Chromatium okenii]MBK1642233.1 hypothetical protein [Chromatium okenii]